MKYELWILILFLILNSLFIIRNKEGFISNKCLPFNKVPEYLKRLAWDFEVWFTVKQGKELIWTNNISLMDNWQFGISHIPPKVFFLPGFEIISSNSSGNGIQIPRTNNQKKILFGVHPVDIKALTLLDKLMSKSPADFYWQKKRKQFIIIGMGDFEFSKDSNCDIFLEENADVFDIYLHKPKIVNLLKYRGIFSKCVLESERKKEEFDPLFSDMEKLAKAIKKSYKSRIWDDLAEICLGCGICAYTCPLCYCFETKDGFRLDNKTCSSCRMRRWSSCFAPDFFKVAGHNFRPKLRDRIYNWYHHKFVRMPTEIGHVGCVDCGRCIKYCPAKINFKTILQSIIE